ncbi:uncharacterized protein KY384_006271 [Bacidia gigantensis]|uniref:uncharacterized protein n=1 Tax=Bacidia gigantensis TaxID=2732470 RepID=UPI001D048CFE|nr:uncharacterized protein KY384_006271 [Bacidia gigantensis]KAG8528584.1 hypothetical protein KY384_006271 [Bacidia gigantensis]
MTTCREASYPTPLNGHVNLSLWAAQQPQEQTVPNLDKYAEQTDQISTSLRRIDCPKQGIKKKWEPDLVEDCRDPSFKRQKEGVYLCSLESAMASKMAHYQPPQERALPSRRLRAPRRMSTRSMHCQRVALASKRKHVMIWPQRDDKYFTTTYDTYNRHYASNKIYPKFATAGENFPAINGKTLRPTKGESDDRLSNQWLAQLQHTPCQGRFPYSGHDLVDKSTNKKTYFWKCQESMSHEQRIKKQKERQFQENSPQTLMRGKREEGMEGKVYRHHIPDTVPLPKRTRCVENEHRDFDGYMDYEVCF